VDAGLDLDDGVRRLQELVRSAVVTELGVILHGNSLRRLSAVMTQCGNHAAGQWHAARALSRA